MTKAKAPKGSPVWYSHSHRLSSKARDVLARTLGFDAVNDAKDTGLAECLRGVEFWLGFYPGAVSAIDNAPTTSVYTRELKAVRKNAIAVMNLLGNTRDGINQFTRDTLNAHFSEPASVTGLGGIERTFVAVTDLFAACNSALDALALEKKSGQGRKKSEARERVLANLVRLYGEYSKLPLEPRAGTGFAVKRSAFEQGEIDFVRAAFADIREDKFSDIDDRGDRKWAALIRAAQPATAQQNPPRAPKRAKK